MSDIKVKHELKIYEPEPSSAYGISVGDWDYIKSKVRQMKDESGVFMVIWSAFLGAFISSLIYTLTSDFPKPPVGSISAAKAISWSATILCFAVSVLCFLFWRKISQSQQTKASYVLEQMEMVVTYPLL